MLVLKNEVNSFWANFCPGETITTHFSFIFYFVGNRRNVSKVQMYKCTLQYIVSNRLKIQPERSLENCYWTFVIVKKSYWLFFKKRRASVVNKVHLKVFAIFWSSFLSDSWNRREPRKVNSVCQYLSVF